MENNDDGVAPLIEAWPVYALIRLQALRAKAGTVSIPNTSKTGVLTKYCQCSGLCGPKSRGVVKYLKIS
ncbi:hypothetical protein [Mucilaginibacter sp. OK283]|jgi:hypothetical protein|uniref:hypothetical protein n=1 Tax=Mucilaginibacter sp. OK283 TaxID=1881049 RepID=UPI0008D39EEF|nr:hypothetical protein [Mucilaginibacter sp. OK283]SEO59549.1 hypothetical protein SAMN05428947_10365 [Mucilaginibacter sp. OK283]